MRKMLLIAVASCALVALIPATALARHNERRHHHRGDNARVHHRSFGGDQGNAGRSAGTVVSFTGGVLTIKANDGNTASGQITNATELKCEQPEPAGMRSHDRGRGGDDGGEAGNAMCTTTDLVPGAIVQDAELTISGAGAVWDEVELVAQPSHS